MEPTPLYTRDGHFVTGVHVPTFDPPPEVIAWGSRVFVRCADGLYREGMPFVVVTDPVPDLIWEDRRGCVGPAS